MLGEMGLLRILATSLVFLCPLLPVGAEVIRVKGSDTLGAKLVPLLAEAFKARNPGLSIEIVAGGSSSAFSELARGTADIGMATRRPRPGEIAAAARNGMRFEEIVACHDIFAVVVHKNNPVPGLTKEQVAGIFTGKIRDWREVGGTPGPITVYTRNTASGSYEIWQKLAMGGLGYAPGAIKVAGGTGVPQLVASDIRAITYVGLAHSRESGIRALPIDGVSPVAGKARTYAFALPCFYYLPDKAKPAARAFVAIAKGEEGRALIEQTGFVAD